jgi:hypothetical protein
MSRFSVKNETNEMAHNASDEVLEGEIEPSDLIDIEENKPKNVDREDFKQSEKVSEKGSEKTSTKEKSPHRGEPMVIERKPVSTLTEEEKTYLYNLYKGGGEHENFKVYFYKNGNHKIVRKKAPPKYNTAKRMLEQQKALDKERGAQNPIMTNEQMLFSHIIDLEAKYATLYEKHKKLKKNYKTMYYDVYEDDQSNEIINEQNESIMEQSNEITKEQNESIKEDAQPPVSENLMEGPAMPENKYLNRVMRQARGYRKRMINNF